MQYEKTPLRLQTFNLNKSQLILLAFNRQLIPEILNFLELNQSQDLPERDLLIAQMPDEESLLGRQTLPNHSLGGMPTHSPAVLLRKPNDVSPPQ